MANYCLIKFLMSKGREWEKRVVDDLATKLVCSAGGDWNACVCFSSKNERCKGSLFLLINLLL